MFPDGEQLPAVLQGKRAFYFWMGAALWVAGLGGSLCTRTEGLQGVCRGPWVEVFRSWPQNLQPALGLCLLTALSVLIPGDQPLRRGHRCCSHPGKDSFPGGEGIRPAEEAHEAGPADAQ